MALLRRKRLPDDVRARLAAGDRVLAFAQTTDQRWVVATPAHLVLLEDGGGTRRRGWTDVDRARLERASEVLVVTWVDGSAPTDLPLSSDATRLATVVRERIQASVVHTEHVALPVGGRAKVVLRRAADGALFSQVIGPGRLDLDDPAVAAVVDAAEARVRSAAGLPT